MYIYTYSEWNQMESHPITKKLRIFDRFFSEVCIKTDLFSSNCLLGNILPVIIPLLS